MHDGVEGVRIPCWDHNIDKVEDDIRVAAINIDQCLSALENAIFHCANYFTVRKSETENESTETPNEESR